MKGRGKKLRDRCNDCLVLKRRKNRMRWVMLERMDDMKSGIRLQVSKIRKGSDWKRVDE